MELLFGFYSINPRAGVPKLFNTAIHFEEIESTASQFILGAPNLNLQNSFTFAVYNFLSSSYP